MSYKLRKISVIDLEATCWEAESPPGEISEIIEIGIVTVNLTTKTLEDTCQHLVIPIESHVSEFCTNLTGHTEKHLRENGVQFCDLVKTLIRHGTKNRAAAGWGDYDANMVRDQCKDRKVINPFGPTYFNVKALFAMAYGLQRGCGLEKALEILGWQFEGNPHRGVDDAYNTAKIFLHLVTGMQIGVVEPDG